MESRRQDYAKFYCDQVGSGIPVYRGSRFMHGHGFLGRLAKRAALPLFKFLGKHLANAGLDIADDVISGRQNFKSALKSSLKSNSKNAAEEAIPILKRKISNLKINSPEQQGSGKIHSRKRKRVRVKKPHRRRIKRAKPTKRVKKTRRVASNKTKSSLDSSISSRTLEKYPFLKL